MTTQFYRAVAAHAAKIPGLILGFVARGAGVLAVCAACGPEAAATPPGPVATTRVSQTQRLMGVPWTITVHAESPAAGGTAIDAGFAEVARLERILSDYDPESELSRLSAAAPTAAPRPVGDDLWRVLVRAVEIRDATDGAFDPTVGPLTSLWRQARRSGRLPLPNKLAAARGLVGPQTLRLVPDDRGVVLTRPAMRLDLGGIGMGYAVDRAVEVLNRHGITSAMVDASGDIAVTAAPPGTAGWRIAMTPLGPGGSDTAQRVPAEYLLLEHAAVTTSGDAFQAVEIDGRRYSHIVDPRTGFGVAGPAAVTVIAADCTTADAMATAASVLGPEHAGAVIASTPDCAARFVSMKDGRLRCFQTDRWPSQSSQSPR
jgi:thiamine biosynthesis lipoprotein